MKPEKIRTLGATFLAALSLVGCATSRVQPIAPGIIPNAIAQTSVQHHNPPRYRVIYNFGATGGDGFYPSAALIDVDGTLYGTTQNGGSSSACGGGCGTVFSVTTAGAEKVLYGFSGGGSDGANPVAPLINSNGTFYGTTQNDGRFSGGTVFSLTSSGSETLLHSFGGTSGGYDGKTPVAGLLDVNGILYGTTTAGGTYGAGTVFSIGASNKERVLHSFDCGKPYDYCSDGDNPQAAPIELKGKLYGTTANGGEKGVGTVFSLTTSGKETVLHSFPNDHTDGALPAAQVLALKVKGAVILFGTTRAGGATGYNYGTVYEVYTSGVEEMLHTFGPGTDGKYPVAGLVPVKNVMYGTTGGGGEHGDGTIFSIDTRGRHEDVLHSFGSGSDGKQPLAALVDVNGTLYGTTQEGGEYGDGTVFALKP